MALSLTTTVMAGLVPGIHALHPAPPSVDGRDKPGHDEEVANPDSDVTGR